MKIIIADHSGFCYGVKRAIDLAVKNSNELTTYSYGDIIHNKDEINRLKSYNIEPIYSLEKLKDNSKVVIRSHGEPRKTYKYLKEKNINIIDATCPYVKRIHSLVEEYSENGFTIFLIGNKNHPEVTASMGWALGDIYVFASPEEINNFKGKADKILVLAQTTIKASLWSECEKAIKSKYDNVVFINTICSATSLRQNSTRSLAKEVDAMLIIGGKKSSNTKKLYDISLSINPNTFFYENKNEIIVQKFKNYDIIGISAGASTPKWVVDELVEKLLNESEE